MQIIDVLHLVMAILLFITALQRFHKQGESFFIRLLLSVWFLLTTIFILPVEIVRNGSTAGIAVMLLFETTAPFLRHYWERK